MKKYLAAGIIFLASNTVFAEEWRGKGEGSCSGSDWPFTFTASVSNGKLVGMLKTSSFDFPLKGDVKDGLAWWICTKRPFVLVLTRRIVRA